MEKTEDVERGDRSSKSVEQSDTTAISQSISSAINFAPVQKAKIDLFARAPEVRKMSRREKRKLALAQSMTDMVESDKKFNSVSRSKKEELNSASSNKIKKFNNNNNNSSGENEKSTLGERPLFESIFVEDKLSSIKNNNFGDDGNSTTSGKSKSKGKPTSKRSILRHALHENPEEDRRTVFVGNLPNTIEKREVEKIFKKCGQIEAVRIRCQALEPCNNTDKTVGRAIRVLRKEIRNDPTVSAVAYVLFKHEEDIAKALEINGIIYNNRHIVVTTLDVKGKFYPPETSVFIGNIAPNTVEEDIWNYFASEGITDVKRVRLVRDRDSGACQGFGYVEFQHSTSVKAAISSRGNVCNGRPLRIVHVNQAKGAKAATISRRERRMSQFDQNTSMTKSEKNNHGYNPNKRARSEQERNQRKSSSSSSSLRSTSKQVVDGEHYPWMGVVTNPRKKIPRDLRPLSEPKKENTKRGNTIVKHKTRNPEKHDSESTFSKS